MSSLFFFYTLAFIALCIVTAVVSLIAWYSSRRRSLACAGILFLAYAVELSEIFFFEYLWQNVSFPSSDYYDISNPIMRTAIAAVAQACIWLIVLNLLERRGKLLTWGPVAAFVVLSLAATLISEGPLRQWCYYIVRTLFLLGTLAYLAISWYRLPEGRLKTSLANHRKTFVLLLVLALLVAVEDTIVILVIPATGQLSDLYLSERNFSENALVAVFAVLTMQQATKALAVRIREAPTSETVSDLDRAIAEHMPAFQERHGLSAREAVVLSLVLEGKTNQQIASELYLALGTVKTHVHNIMKKTETTSRESLTLGFWQDK